MASATRARVPRWPSLYPPELLAETLRIAERATSPWNSCSTPIRVSWCPKDTIRTAGRVLVERGIRWRWKAASKQRTQIEHELALIKQKNYASYFSPCGHRALCAQPGHLCQGRGSAANSAVCFVLGVTEIDPARSNLLFERFISAERDEPPDIDIDFEHERRE